TDLSQLEISTYVPQECYDRVLIGKSIMKIIHQDRELGEVTIVYKSPTINTVLRTFEVRGKLESDSMKLVPGNLVRVLLVTERREGAGIPSGAVVMRKDKACVFINESGKALLKEIETGLENEGRIEIRSGEVTEKDQVIHVGQNMLNPGDPVKVTGGGN
ncbi:MAG: hypothetical protein PHQ23_08190, partial [Candidatus Wallbacteria bacterium]|nr:hypothetical protein [Candidatus Wallbacteria bacterium]